nr:DUF2812 domain-containing protein [Virgibacillus sp. SK37]
MKETKYITSGGLAFSEDQDMEKLRQYSLKGWHVSDFKFMGYTLEKGESSDYIYNIDYRSLKDGEEEEYFGFFHPLDGHMLLQKEMFIYFEHILVQNQFIRTMTQQLKSIKIQLTP